MRVRFFPSSNSLLVVVWFEIQSLGFFLILGSPRFLVGFKCDVKVSVLGCVADTQQATASMLAEGPETPTSWTEHSRRHRLGTEVHKDGENDVEEFIQSIATSAHGS